MENITISNTSTLFRTQSYTESISRKILAKILSFRRIPHLSDRCSNEGCSTCASVYLPKIISAVERNEAVTFVLPAFPGKSPNPEKVLGVLPDYAERLSLKFLGDLCESMREIYSPGMKLILCSDGRVFSDVVGIKEQDITDYQEKLSELIKDLSLKDLSTFNLDDVYQNQHFSLMREKLMNRFGIELSELKQKIKNEDPEAQRMYCGIVRFLFEDSLFAGQTKTRSALQKEAREKGYEVIRRSNAWSELIEERFPEALRLSIHPQTCGAKKIGIRLIENEVWMTPWHGVAVETSAGPKLYKRHEAEAMGAKLVCTSEGVPSHFILEKVVAYV